MHSALLSPRVGLKFSHVEGRWVILLLPAGPTPAWYQVCLEDTTSWRFAGDLPSSAGWNSLTNLTGQTCLPSAAGIINQAGVFQERTGHFARRSQTCPHSVTLGLAFEALVLFRGSSAASGSSFSSQGSVVSSAMWDWR